MKLTRELQVVKVEGHKYVNITASGDVIKGISTELKFPISNYFLTDSQLHKMINSKLQ